MKIRIFLFPVLVFSLFLFSCAEKNVMSGNEHYLKSSTTIFGVGYNMDMAQSDLNSVFYAYRQGVNYRFSGDELKLRLDYSNKIQLLTVEDLTNASLKRIIDNFYVYELPETVSIYVHGGKWQKFRTSFSITQPVSYLSKMLARAIIEEIGKSHKKDQSGYIYITSLKYGVSAERGLTINADLLLTEMER